MLCAVIGLSVVVAIAGCGAAPTPVVTPEPVATVAPTGDGVLRIGTIFPSTGASAFIAPAQVAGVEVAIKEINEAGGVNGVPVEVFHRDSADAAVQKTEESFADLVTKAVDVIIGPSSSVLAERLIPLAVDAGVAVISPAATFPKLSTIPDDGLFFRTIPSYAHQGTLLGEYLSEGGPVKVALVYLDDELGVAIEESLRPSLDEAGSSLAIAEKFDATTTDFAPTIAAVKDAEPDLVVLSAPFSAMEQSKALITQLSAAGFGGSKLWLTSQNTADYSQALPVGLLKDVNGIIEGVVPDDGFVARLKQSDPAIVNSKYGAEAYDATILAALAAIVAGDDGGPSIAMALHDVSIGGIKCASFGECIDVLKTQDDIDYDGLAGPLNFTATGDITPAWYSIYAYNAENRFDLKTSIIGG